MKFIRLFEPITINQLIVKNRIVMPAMALFYTKDYTLTEKFRAFYRRRAAGGVGLMLVGPVAVGVAGSEPFMLGLFRDTQMESMKRFIDELHNDYDIKIGTQLMHKGYYAFSRMTGSIPIAASAVRCPLTGETPREMTIEDIEEVKRSFAQAAKRARDAGFDYLEIVMGGGYLISGFLSPLTNHRTDAYGGSIENRMRFGLEVIKVIRNTVGKDFPLGIRISPHDFMNGGNTNVEAAIFCSRAESVGIDAANLANGWHATQVPQITSDVPRAAFLYLARGIKEKVTIPVFVSGRLGDPVVAEKALRSGFTDMICWGRPLLADPELPNEVRDGKSREVTRCIACNEGCLDSLFSWSSVFCAVNPQTGHEDETKIKPAATKKKIFVVGGGPAGMEFALVARLRGHDVTLFEQSDGLGGQLCLASAVPGKREFFSAIESLTSRIEVAGVNVRLNTTVTSETVQEAQPDVLVVATGAKEQEVNVPGGNLRHVVRAQDILMENVPDVGKNVVIVGASGTGCEVAHFIAQMGLPEPDVVNFLIIHGAEEFEKIRSMILKPSRNITVIDMKERIASNVGLSARWPLLKKLRLMGVDIRSKTKLIAITEDSVVVQTDGGEETIPADTVIIAVGSRSVADLAREAEEKVTKVVVIGDAKEPRRISNAIQEGFYAALSI
jgi:2,4-dienoyl-CoA reductase (NADPH2)